MFVDWWPLHVRSSCFKLVNLYSYVGLLGIMSLLDVHIGLHSSNFCILSSSNDLLDVLLYLLHIIFPEVLGYLLEWLFPTDIFIHELSLNISFSLSFPYFQMINFVWIMSDLMLFQHFIKNLHKNDLLLVFRDLMHLKLWSLFKAGIIDLHFCLHAWSVTNHNSELRWSDCWSHAIGWPNHCFL